MGEGITRNM